MGKKHIKNNPDRVPTDPILPDPITLDPVATDEVVQGERDALSTVPPDVFVPEDQRQRWLKYGANVALSTVVVLVLAGVVVWAFEGTQKATRGLRGRADLTGDSSNVLKPQTKQLIGDLPGEVTLVSLYPKLKKEEAASKGADTYQRVQDILDEYRRNGKNIKVEYIDPVADPGKLDAWIGQVKRTYGKNIENYEKFVKEFPKTLEEIKGLAKAEAEQIKKVSQELQPGADKLTDEQLAMIQGTVQPAYSTVLVFPQLLEQMNEGAKAELEQKIPDYAAAVQSIKGGLSGLSRQSDQLATVFAKLKDEKTAPDAVKKYAEAAVPRFQAIKAKADESVKKTEALGELKLDEVRKKILPGAEGEAAPPAIVAMSKDDIRVIDDFNLWKSGETTGMTGRSNAQPRLRFAGEQQLTSAILGLSQAKKQRVAFVRAGGPPLVAGGGGMMGGGGPGPFGEIADRLKGYNFDVVEKDLGPPNPMRQQMPTPDEPTDEQLKDAVWVVFSNESQQDPRMGMMGGAPGALGERLKQHLDGGGSALCLVNFQGEDLAPALKDWGIEVKPATIIVHERIEGGEANANDFIEQARREPYVFVLNEFGDHPVTAPLRSLDAAMVPMVQVKKAATVPAGVTVTQIIPIPQSPKAWGETDLSSLQPPPGTRRQPPPPAFDPAADAAAPLFAGAVAETQGKGRLVVIGSQNFASNTLVNLPDPEMLRKAKPMVVSRFPGNGELVTNSVFWLARNEKMIALSPSAMDTARIEPIPAGQLGFLKIGVVLIALPLMAVAAGIAVWMNRRG